MRTLPAFTFILLWSIPFAETHAQMGFSNPQVPTFNGTSNQGHKVTTDQQLIDQRQRRTVSMDEEELRQLRDDIKGDPETNYYTSNIYQDSIRHYNKAFMELYAQLEGKEPINLKRAVFLVENAYYDGKLNYNDYCAKLDELLLFCKEKLKADGYSEQDSVAKNLVLYKLFTETLIRSSSQGTKVKHSPFKYNFNDFWGHKDWTKQFVVKVLYSNSGQCHSLPLLYMILAQELGTQAYLAYSPNHSYIKFHDYKGVLHNFETTNGHLVSDKWIMGCQYIKSEAIQNGLYMVPLNYKQVVAQCANDLADGFQIKFGFGYGQFLQDCSDLSLAHQPRGNFHALSNRSNLHLGQFERLRMLHRVPPTQEAVSRFINDNYKAYSCWQSHDWYYRQITDMGYENMPPAAYAAWLKSVETEKAKSDHNRSLSSMKGQGK